MTREEAIKWLEETKFGGQMLHDNTVIRVCDMAISALREQEERRWIPVSERVPKQTDPAEKVLFVTESGGLFIGCYYKGVSTRQFDGWYSMCTRIDKVTHWMPLPEPPKEDSNG